MARTTVKGMLALTHAVERVHQARFVAKQDWTLAIILRDMEHAHRLLAIRTRNAVQAEALFGIIDRNFNNLVLYGYAPSN